VRLASHKLAGRCERLNLIKVLALLDDRILLLIAQPHLSPENLLDTAYVAG
jgi:hypothetical protein